MQTDEHEMGGEERHALLEQRRAAVVRQLRGLAIELTDPKSRWHIPGGVDEITAALQAGRAVIVSSRLLWSALAAAGRSGRLVISPPEVSSPVVTG